ncbi:chymotrypsin-1-like [Choristoneura fumiferana]|uniref:chymotrypsin-1-like n=1 Tax=Choristoneura fumiferana TaxID=7141 RepID=UPI003D15F04C
MYEKLLFGFVLTTLLNFSVQGSTLRIIGGHEAPSKFGYYHASLQNLTGSHVCGGAVVSERHVVTAAHCVQGTEPQYIKIVVGTTNLDEGGKQYDVEAIKIYNDFNFSERANDIAMLKISEAFNLNDIEIIKLDENYLNENDTVILTGFGAVQVNGESSRLMHILDLTVFSQEICRYAMRNSRAVLDNMFCTFTRMGEGTCHGDSGGPLIKDNKLVGLVSWGIPCAVGFPDVHTRIAPYADWIQKEIVTF